MAKAFQGFPTPASLFVLSLTFSATSWRCQVPHVSHVYVVPSLSSSSPHFGCAMVTVEETRKLVEHCIKRIAAAARMAIPPCGNLRKIQLQFLSSRQDPDSENNWPQLKVLPPWLPMMASRKPLHQGSSKYINSRHPGLIKPQWLHPVASLGAPDRDEGIPSSCSLGYSTTRMVSSPGGSMELHGAQRQR